MNEMRPDFLSLPCCGLPGESKYPPLAPIWPSTPQRSFDPALPDEEYADFYREIPASPLPYARLTGYTREKREQALPVFVLENNRLRATVMPTLGGRVWSLVDKKTGRELLYRNPVLQFGKLAIRDAWFSGGIEWNIGFLGHSTYTASDIFVGRLTGANGHPVLRLWEWERTTEVAYQVDLFFPDDDAEFLFAAPRIVNANDREVRTYYWSNTALPVTRHTRVIVPTRQALIHEDGIRLVTTPDHHGVDATYPDRIDHAIDYFYYLPKGTRPWEAAVEADGCGLLCTGTSQMRGRKLFLWGHNAGGDHWTEFLAAPGMPYIEIQGGLAKTQMETVPLAAHSELFWLESFGPIQLNPELAHDPEYSTAMRHCAEYVQRHLNDDTLQQMCQAAYQVSLRPVETICHHGSGWGALECRRRAADRQPPLAFGDSAYPTETLGTLQKPWLTLLDAQLPGDEALEVPSWQVSDHWYKRLQAARAYPGAAQSGWLAFQLSLNAMLRKEYATALQELQSLPEAKQDEVNIQRLFAWLYTKLEREPEALAAWRKALRLAPNQVELLQEASALFFRLGLYDEFLHHLPADGGGRIRLLAGRCRMELGDLAAVEAIFATPFEIPDLLEGECAFTDLYIELLCRRAAEKRHLPWNRETHLQLWQEFHLQVPRWIDFRMRILPPADKK